MSYDRATGRTRESVLIYIGGAVTSAVTLVLLYFLRKVEFDPLIFYVLYIIPAGAVATGLVAGSGYSLVAWKMNVRVTTASLVRIGLAGVVCFFLAHYMTYLGMLAAHGYKPGDISFLQYLQYLCEGMTYGEVGEEGAEIGGFGYVLQAVSGMGFAAGGIIPHLVLRAMAYCEGCQLYMKRIARGVLSSKAVKPDLKKKNKADKKEIIEAAVAEVLEPTQRMLDVVMRNRLADNEKLMEAIPPERVKNSIAGVTIAMRKCPGCERHVVKAALQNLTVDGQGKATEVGTATGLLEGEGDPAATAEADPEAKGAAPPAP
jgi:hypothetical protein